MKKIYISNLILNQDGIYADIMVNKDKLCRTMLKLMNIIKLFNKMNKNNKPTIHQINNLTHLKTHTKNFSELYCYKQVRGISVFIPYNLKCVI